MDDIFRKGGNGGPDLLLLNKLFDSIIPSMRTSKTQNGCQGAPKRPTGSGNMYILSNFRKISFLIRALLLLEKQTTEKNEKKRKKKRTV